MSKYFGLGNIGINFFFNPFVDVLVIKIFDPEPIDTLFEISILGIGFGVYWFDDVGWEN